MVWESEGLGLKLIPNGIRFCLHQLSRAYSTQACMDEHSLNLVWRLLWSEMIWLNCWRPKSPFKWSIPIVRVIPFTHNLARLKEVPLFDQINGLFLELMISPPIKGDIPFSLKEMELLISHFFAWWGWNTLFGPIFQNICFYFWS